MSLSVRLLARLLGLGRTLFKICRDQTWRIYLRFCIVLSVKITLQLSSLMFGYGNRIRIIGFFPALMTPEAQSG